MPASTDQSNDRQRIAIIGGGFAGAFTARALRRSLPDNIEVELISDRNYFVFQPLLPEVVAGTINAQDAVTPLRLLLKGVSVRLGEVCDIDFERQRLQVSQGSRRIPAYRRYDQLVIAPGQRTVLERFPGFAEHSFSIRDLSNAHELRNHVIQCLEHADITENPQLKQKLLTFVIAGAGFSGVEIAGELHEMLSRTLHLYPKLQQSDLRTIIVQRGQRILPELPEALGVYAAERLQHHGVEVRYGTSLARATDAAVFTADGECIDTKTLITTVGNGPLPLVEKLKLPMERGRIRTDRCMRVEGFDNVWSAGDAAHVPMGDDGHGAPTTAQFAVAQARTLASNLCATIEGRPPEAFTYTPRGTMASIGHYRAVAEVFGLRFSGLFAWLMWRGFYIGMLPGFSTRLRVALNWLFDYFLPRSIVQVKTRTGRAVRHLHHAKGDVLFAPGQIVDGLYVVISGTLESRVPMREGEDFVRILGQGDHWGERSLTEHNQTLGSLTAVDDCEIMVLGSEDFASLQNGMPVVSDYFSRIPDKIYPPSLRAKEEKPPASH